MDTQRIDPVSPHALRPARRVDARADSGGVSFSAILAANLTGEETKQVVYNQAFSALQPKDSHALAAEAAAKAASTAAAAGSKYFPNTYDDLIHSACESYGVSAALVKAVIRAESAYDPDATSRAGAMGLMQLMPGTAEDLGVTDAYDPAQNIDGGVKYLARMLRRYDGDLTLALAAYNWGPGSVSRSGAVEQTGESRLALLPSSTVRYIERIHTYVEQLTA